MLKGIRERYSKDSSRNRDFQFMKGSDKLLTCRLGRFSEPNRHFQSEIISSNYRQFLTLCGCNHQLRVSMTMSGNLSFFINKMRFLNERVRHASMRWAR